MNVKTPKHAKQLENVIDSVRLTLVIYGAGKEKNPKICFSLSILLPSNVMFFLILSN
jgi:hypothetical protein